MRSCVIIPSYQDASTLADVVRGALRECPDVIVIDDGSSDGTREVLAAIPEATVLRHEVNRGKGAALRSGLAEAHRRGFTHAVSLDSDGQHLASDIPAVLQAAGAEPRALVLGHRDLIAAGAGRGSRLGRRISNFWTWVETGLRLPDTQTGYRVYPVSELETLEFSTTGFDFEVDVIVRAAWAGLPIVSVPVAVRYSIDGARASHLRPVVDFLRIARLNTKLVFLRLCLPTPVLALLSKRSLRSLSRSSRLRVVAEELFLREPGSPRRIGASVALGLFCGLAPIWGFQLFFALLLAHWLRLSKGVVAVASHISLPILIPFIVYASLVLGRVLLHRSAPAATTMTGDPAAYDLLAWVLGSFALAAVVGLVGGALAWGAVAVVRSRRRGTRCA